MLILRAKHALIDPRLKQKGVVDNVAVVIDQAQSRLQARVALAQEAAASR